MLRCLLGTRAMTILLGTIGDLFLPDRIIVTIRPLVAETMTTTDEVLLPPVTAMVLRLLRLTIGLVTATHIVAMVVLLLPLQRAILPTIVMTAVVDLLGPTVMEVGMVDLLIGRVLHQGTETITTDLLGTSRMLLSREINESESVSSSGTMTIVAAHVLCLLFQCDILIMVEDLLLQNLDTGKIPVEGEWLVRCSHL